MKYGNYQNENDIDFIDSDDIECIRDIVVNPYEVSYVLDDTKNYQFKFDATNGDDHVKLCCTIDKNAEIESGASIKIGLEKIAEIFNKACDTSITIDDDLNPYKEELILSIDHGALRYNTAYTLCGYIEYNSHIIGTFDKLHFNKNQVTIGDIVCSYDKLMKQDEVIYYFVHNDKTYKIIDGTMHNNVGTDMVIDYDHVAQVKNNNEHFKEYNLSITKDIDADIYHASRAAVLTQQATANRYNFADDLL